MNKTSYHLSLANGQEWYLQASPSLESWLTRFADIMQLPSVNQNGSPTWNFVYQDECTEIFSPDTHISSHGRLISVHVKPDGTDLTTVIAPVFKENENEDIVRMMVATQSLYLATWPKGGIPVHAALIEKEGYGILIAAAGGTGKSTCARRIPPPWHSICDDSVLLVPVGNQYHAHPLPTWSDFLLRNWMDQRWDVNRSIPVSALWFLEQGEEDESYIIGKGEGATRFYQSAVQMSNPCMRRADNEEIFKDWHGSLFNRCCDAVSTFSCGALRATLDGKFWEYI